MFTSSHFVWLALSCTAIGALLFVSLRFRWRLTCAARVMTVIGIVSETSKILSNMEVASDGARHLDPLCLPFHLCSVMLYFVIFITLNPNERIRRVLINFVAVMGTVGSFFALLIPTNGVDFTDIGAYQCFVYHAALLWFSLYLIASGQAKLGLRTYLTNLGMLSGLTILMLYINGALSAYDSNFMYLTRPPMDNLPVLNLEHGWYVYFLTLVGIAVVMLTLFHLPFMIHQARKRTRVAEGAAENASEPIPL